MFVVIDGLDGSGKATQVELIAKKLRGLGKKVRILDYPRYEEKSSFAVQKYLNGEYGKNIGPEQASIFYALDRFDDSFSLKKDMDKYDYIISNRYVSANMIHQSGKISDEKQRNKFLDWLENLEYNIFGIPKPDKVIFLDVTPDISQELVLKKSSRKYIKGGKKMDIHEEDKNHLYNAWIVANEIIKKYNWIKVECVKNGKIRTIEDINKEILSHILL